MSDQAQNAGAESGSQEGEAGSEVPKILQDYVGMEEGGDQSNSDDQPDEATGREKVTSEENAEENQTPSDDDVQSQEGQVDEQQGDGTQTGENEDEDSQEDQDTQEEDGEETYEVAGQEYDSFDDAVEAVNKISGENTRLAGENKKLSAKVEQKNKKIQELTDKLQDWNEFYEDVQSGDVDPEEDGTPEGVDVEDLVEKKLAEKEQNEIEQERKEQFKKEMNEISKKDNFDDVKETMTEIAKDIGEEKVRNKLSPKKLYNMALGVKYGGNLQQAKQEAQEITEEKKKTKEKQKQAKKVTGGKKNQTPSKNDEELSPMMDNYIKHG